MLYNSKSIKTVCQMSWNEAYNFVIWRVRQTWTGSPTTNMLNHDLKAVSLSCVCSSLSYQHYASLLLDWTKKTSQIWLLSSCGIMMIIDQIHLNGQAPSLQWMTIAGGLTFIISLSSLINKTIKHKKSCPTEIKHQMRQLSSSNQTIEWWKALYVTSLKCPAIRQESSTDIISHSC